jgi:hypothetical protein
MKEKLREIGSLCKQVVKAGRPATISSAARTHPLEEEENWNEKLQLIYQWFPWLESSDRRSAKSPTHSTRADG